MNGPPPELEAAVLGRKGVRRGSEIDFLCPAHDDHNPSASYNVEKQAWFCHGCGAKGGWRDLCNRLGIDKPSSRRRGGEIEATYSYFDANDALVFQVVRKANPKGFRQRRPDGKGGWIWNLKDIERVLYRLPEVLAAIQAGKPIFLPEGEKDVENLVALGLAATTNPGGAEKWRSSYSESLQGARVVVLPDNDAPGRKHASSVAGAIQSKVEEVRILEFPDLPPKGDVSDWIELQAQAGKEKHEIRQSIEALAAAAPLWTTEAHEGGLEDSTEGDREPKRQSQTEILAVLAAGAEVFHSSDQTPYGRLEVEDHHENWPVRSKAFRDWLVREFYLQEGKPPSTTALQEALRLVEARARFDGPTLDVSVRVGHLEETVYVDLGDKSWDAVEITRAGWRIVSNPPIRFRRCGTTGALPRPRKGGSLRELNRHVNSGAEDQLLLMVAWMVGAYRPSGPYPILILQGEQGSAKSTAARMLRSLVDPAGAQLRSKPRNEQDLMIAANQSRVLAFDNLSGVRDWFSDALCRLATGGGFSARQLYTDAEEVVFEAQRPTLLNGIDDLASRQDLADRSIVLQLPPIPDTQRRTEKELWRDFEAARPRILGALFDAVSAALRNQSEVELAETPRMADFAHWIVASESALGWPAGQFMEAYQGNRRDAIEVALENDPVAAAVVELLAEKEKWTGTATEVLTALEPYVSPRLLGSRRWPRSAKGISSRLSRAATFLRAAGCEVEFYREAGRGSRRLIALRKTLVFCVANVANVASKDPTDGNDCKQESKPTMGLSSDSSHSEVVASHLQGDSSHADAPRNGVCDECDECDAPARPFSEGHALEDSGLI